MSKERDNAAIYRKVCELMPKGFEVIVRTLDHGIWTGVGIQHNETGRRIAFRALNRSKLARIRWRSKRMSFRPAVLGDLEFASMAAKKLTKWARARGLVAAEE